MKNYLFPLGVLVVLAALAAGAWYLIEGREAEEAQAPVVSDERYDQCMNFMMVAQFPTGVAADDFLAACLRGEPVLPEDIGDVPPPSETPPPNATPVSTNVGPGCAIGGCSSQVCGEAGEVEDIVTTCEYREEYACYQSARCEKQSSGSCGWTETDEYKQCVANIGTVVEVEVN